VFIFVSIAQTVALKNLNISWNIINSTKFVELRPAADLYQSIFFYQAITAALLLVRTIYFLKMNSEFEIIFVTLEKTGKLIVTYCMLVIPLVMAFAISGMILWSAYSPSFVSLDQAFLSCILLALGRFDRNILIEADYIPTIVYLTVYYLFVIFFLITVLVGLYVDNYRLTMMDYGYNYALFGEKKTVKDLFKWLFAWVPSQIMEKIDKEEDTSKPEDIKRSMSPKKTTLPGQQTIQMVKPQQSGMLTEAAVKKFNELNPPAKHAGGAPPSD